MIHYVAGFMFAGDAVALMRKRCDLLNGIGGRVKENETAMEAMEREFREETGCTVTNWRHYCRLSSHEFTVHFFSCNGDLSLLKRVVICDINNLHDIVPNLKWLIPMALDNIRIAQVKIDSLPGES